MINISALWIGGRCIKENEMDEDALKHLLALREVNKALIKGLKAAVFTMENWGNLSQKRRQTTIKSVREIISKSEAVYGQEPTRH